MTIHRSPSRLHFSICHVPYTRLWPSRGSWRRCANVFTSHALISSKATDSTSSLFQYTSGRWVYNEDIRLKERQRIFNVDQLQRLAAQAVSRDLADILGIRKLGEGAANRAFLIQFKDGFKLVARIPYPSTEPNDLVVSSEAATLIFLRSKGIPVPEVFGYSATEDNPAGTNYIFMEFCMGTDLGSVWELTTEQDRVRFMTSLVQLEARLLNVHLPASGSLYLRKDLPSDAKKVAINSDDISNPDAICVGPSTSLHFWFGRRRGLDSDRGPFAAPKSVMDAGAIKEMRYLELYGRPLLPFDRFQREAFNFKKQLPSVHMDSLQKYLQISKHLIPRSDRLTTPVLRHPDLRPSNIFISDNFEITGLIDWQYSTADPLFLSSGIPEFLNSRSRSGLPETASTAESGHEEGIEADCLRDTYISLTERYNSSHFGALSYPFSIGRQKIHRLSGDPWQGDNVPLRSSLIFIEEHWSQICADPGVPCPISFGEEEKTEILRLDDAEQQGVEQLEEFTQTIGLGPEGWVSHEDFEAAKAAIARMKEMSLEQAEYEEELTAIRDHWVFDDMDEDEYL